jgi:phosphonate transport system permease protein
MKERVEQACRRELRRNGLAALLFVCAVAYACSHLGLSVAEVPGGLARLGWLARLMMPPAHEGFLPEYLRALAETLAIAFLGTGIAAVIALPLSFAAASNINRITVVRAGMRRLFDLLRGIDAIIWALLFVSALGLGPFAGMLAIACADIGILGRLFADAIENADPRPSEALRAAGATEWIAARFGIWPQVLPVLLSSTLYYFESNTRSATILGIVGGGGIGLILSDRIRANEWPQTAFVLLLILGTVTLIDIASSALRARVVPGLADGRSAVE